MLFWIQIALDLHSFYLYYVLCTDSILNNLFLQKVFLEKENQFDLEIC